MTLERLETSIIGVWAGPGVPPRIYGRNFHLASEHVVGIKHGETTWIRRQAVPQGPARESLRDLVLRAVGELGTSDVDLELQYGDRPTREYA